MNWQHLLLTLVCAVLLASGIPKFSCAQKAHLDSAIAFQGAGRSGDALTEARKAISANYADSAEYHQLHAWSIFASNLYTTGQLPAMLDTVPNALSLPTAVAPRHKINVTRLLGIAHLIMRQYNEAETLLLQVLEIADAYDLNDEPMVVSALNVLGVTYSSKGDWATALRYFNIYIQKLEANGDEEVSSAYLNVATIYEKLEDYDQAEKSLYKALEIRREGWPPADLGIVYSDLGAFNLERDDALALAYLDTALALQQAGGDKRGQTLTLQSLTQLYQKKGEYEKARQFLSERMVINQGDLVSTAIDYQLYADLLDAMGHTDSVAWYLNQAAQIGEDHGYLLVTKNANNRLYQWHKKQGDFKAALLAHEHYFTAYDSIRRKESEEKLEEERARFKVNQAEGELEEAAEENAVLEETNSIYGGWIVALTALFGIALALAVALLRIRKKLAQQNEQLTELIATKNKFFSIIAHDIRSPLVAFQSIGKRIEKAHQANNSEKVQHLSQQLDQSATQLNGLLNNLLSWALLQNGLIQHRPQRIPVADAVLDNVDLFADLTAMKNIEVVTDLPENLSVHADENALNLMLRNLLSNAVKFSPEGKAIRIEAERTGTHIVIRVADHGKGIDKQKLGSLFKLESGSETGTKGEKGTGLGLHLVQELILLHAGKVCVKSELNAGSVFELVFPA